MMRKISLLLLTLSQAINAYALPSSIEVNAYTTHYYPIKNAQLAANIYYLDSVEQLEDQLSYQLSSDPQIAENQVRQKMQTMEWKRTEQSLIQSYVGVTEGWKNGITKVPAVLFTNTDTGKSAVIYGETDIARAIHRYQQIISF
ncbi:TIGR03757 family integrating conjugative element protein [Rodentibacter haemolyticus]|nr:TIGR03757 family integrating conjugative element protein [Rodentibacter haemolyticus]